jgi:putative oxidoreductase
MNMSRAAQVAYFLLRVVSGLLIFQAGAMKSFGWLGGIPPNGGTVPLMSQVGIGGWIEVIGGLLVLLGLLTRPAAFILSGMMAVAYWQFHFAPNGGWPAQNQGVPAVLMCFIFLYIAAQGGGEWSLDALLRGKRGAAQRLL